MGRALDRLARGEVLTFHAQDFSQGVLYSSGQWSRLLHRQVRHIEAHGLVEDMLRKPSRKAALPIVEFPD
jgi:hypothetical protein